MNKIFLIVTIFIFSSSTFSQEKAEPLLTQIEGSKELPLELNLLINSLENSIGHDKFINSIMNIDSYARLLSKEDLFLVSKIEIYKTLLRTNTNFPKATIDENAVNKIKSSIPKAHDPFTKWFLGALIKDADDLMTNPNFKEYLIQKNNGKLDRLELKKIDKKVQLLFRWISLLNPTSSDFQSLFNIELTPILIDALNNIEQSFFQLAISSSQSSGLETIKSPSELKFFTIKKIKREKKLPSSQKTVDDILKPVIDQNSDENKEDNKKADTVLPAPSKENWLNEESTPANLKNLPKPSDDADWLQDF